MIGALAGLGVGSALDARRHTAQGEAAFRAHHNDPTNLVHLARFNAHVARSASMYVVAAVCFVGAGLVLVILKPPLPWWLGWLG